MEYLVPSLPVCSIQWSLCVIRWTTVSMRGQRSREWGVLGHRSETGDTNHRVCLPDLYICNCRWSLNFGKLLSGIFQNFYLLNVLCNYALSKTVFKECTFVYCKYLLLVQYGDDTFSFQSVPHQPWNVTMVIL